MDDLTQNKNVSLNALIWKKFPKNVYVSRNVIEIGVASAVLQFNNGTQGIRKIYENAGLHYWLLVCWFAGKFITAACKKKIKNRIIIMTHKSSDSVKKRRKKFRVIRKGFCDKEKEKQGGESYVSGGY